MEPPQGFDAPDGVLPTYQHWPGNWRVAEGTWDWAGSIGFRAVAVESQDHLEGPPTRPSLRKQYFVRDQQLHGSGELVSWARGRELAGLGLDGALAGIEAEYQAFTAGAAEPAAVERAVCDLFMAARCGDYLDQLLAGMRRPLRTGWCGAVRRAVEFELLSKSQSELLESHAFWRRGVMPELVNVLPASPAKGLPRSDSNLQFGQLLLWSTGACGQILREAIQVDWTDLVLEQGFLRTVAGRNALDPKNHSFARWLWVPLQARCRLVRGERTRKEQVRAHLTEHLIQQAGPFEGLGWRVSARHWARIVEWVLVWRREITNPAMLERAQGLAALILMDETLRGFGDRQNPVRSLEMVHETPRAPGDIPVRLQKALEWSKPLDFRLQDELYPAIAAVVAGWLRGAGLAACAADVFSAASWLKELVPARRLRVVDVLKSAADYARPRMDEIGQIGLESTYMQEHVRKQLGLSEQQQLSEWLAEQALRADPLECFVFALVDTRTFPLELQRNLLDRVRTMGTALPAGLNADVAWGLNCVAQHLRSLPAPYATGAGGSGAHQQAPIRQAQAA